MSDTTDTSSLEGPETRINVNIPAHSAAVDSRTPDTKELSIFELFTMGQKLWNDLQSSDAPSSNDTEYQASVKQALRHFMHASLHFDRQHLISKNEELDDIRTDILKVEGLGVVHGDDLACVTREGRVNQATRRQEIISRGKRDREIREKLTYVLKKRMELIKAKGGNEIEARAEEECGDEEVERQFTLLLIDDAVIKAIALLEMIEIELPMLQEIEVIKARNGGNVPKPPPPTPSKIGNFQILPDGRRVMLDKVFRPSHILPTISPEEAAHWEMHNGGMVSGPGGEASKKKEDNGEDEDGEEDHDKLREARDWDDWKDDNPRGWGNMKG
eukprot:gene15515-18426_t